MLDRVTFPPLRLNALFERAGVNCAREIRVNASHCCRSALGYGEHMCLIRGGSFTGGCITAPRVVAAGETR